MFIKCCWVVESEVVWRRVGVFEGVCVFGDFIDFNLFVVLGLEGYIRDVVFGFVCLYFWG